MYVVHNIKQSDWSSLRWLTSWFIFRPFRISFSISHRAKIPYDILLCKSLILISANVVLAVTCGVQELCSPFKLTLQLNVYLFCGTAENEEQEDLKALLVRKQNLFTALFNFNILSEAEFLSNYVFPKRDIIPISDLLNYEGRKIRNGSLCDPLKRSVSSFI